MLYDPISITVAKYLNHPKTLTSNEAEQPVLFLNFASICNFFSAGFTPHR